MPRPRRADEAGGIYHALLRGNARTPIVRKDADFEAFERIVAYGFSQFSAIDRTSAGTGTYSHDRYGFPVSGAVTVNSEYHFISDHSLLNIMTDGARSPESTGSGYSELSTRSMSDINGGGEDRRTVTTTGPIVNPAGDTIGSYTNKAIYDHNVIENALRDYSSSDRTDYRYDLTSGTLVPTQRRMKRGQDSFLAWSVW